MFVNFPSFILPGFYLQILRGNIGWSCPQCRPQWPKDQLDMQSCSQAQRASRTDICWEGKQGSSWKGAFASQGKTIKKGYLEEEQHSLYAAIPLIFILVDILLSSQFWAFLLKGLLFQLWDWRYRICWLNLVLGTYTRVKLKIYIIAFVFSGLHWQIFVYSWFRISWVFFRLPLERFLIEFGEWAQTKDFCFQVSTFVNCHEHGYFFPVYSTEVVLSTHVYRMVIGCSSSSWFKEFKHFTEPCNLSRHSFWQSMVEICF